MVGGEWYGEGLGGVRSGMEGVRGGMEGLMGSIPHNSIIGIVEIRGWRVSLGVGF